MDKLNMIYSHLLNMLHNLNCIFHISKFYHQCIYLMDIHLNNGSCYRHRFCMYLWHNLCIHFSFHQNKMNKFGSIKYIIDWLYLNNFKLISEIKFTCIFKIFCRTIKCALSIYRVEIKASWTLLTSLIIIAIITIFYTT